MLGVYIFLEISHSKAKKCHSNYGCRCSSITRFGTTRVNSNCREKIADEFVSDGVAAEVASAGINTIREILARAPLAIDAPLLQDLTEYKGSKSKAVMMAARSLISLYREVAPEMLLKRSW